MKFTSVCSCVVIVISLTSSVYGNPNPDDHEYQRRSYGKHLIIGDLFIFILNSMILLLIFVTKTEIKLTYE